MGFIAVTPTLYNVGSAGAWADIDVSALCPGAVAVSLEIINTNTGSLRACGVRKKGSTDNRIQNFVPSQHSGAIIGVDGSQIFQGYSGTTASDILFIVHGYWPSGIDLLTNATDLSAASNNSWLDKTANAAALGAIVETVSSADGWAFGYRKKGSTDTARIACWRHHFHFVGCDGSGVFQVNVENGAVDSFLLGHFLSDVTFNTNRVDVSQTNLATYEDHAAITGATSVFYNVVSSGVQAWALRKNGTTPTERYIGNTEHTGIQIAADSSGIVEGKIANAGVDMFQMGHTTAPPPQPLAAQFLAGD